MKKIGKILFVLILLFPFVVKADVGTPGILPSTIPESAGWIIALSIAGAIIVALTAIVIMLSTNKKKEKSFEAIPNNNEANSSSQNTNEK